MKAERFTAGIFLCVAMGFMVLSFCSLADRVIKTAGTHEVAWKKYIDWEAMYPFEGVTRTKTEKAASAYSYIKDRLKEYTSSKLLGYDKLVETARRYEDVIGWNMESVFSYNAAVRLKDGYMSTYTTSRDIRLDVKAVKDFADFCSERGIDFAYLNFPVKICKSEDKEISGVLDFANQNADRFLAGLKEAGVKCYDFREKLHEDGMKHHEAFFVYDMHWKPQTGLWASRHILKILRNDFGWNINPETLRPENFDYVVYPEAFLGSEGRKLTLARAKPEDFTLIYPKFPTHLKLEIQSIGINSEGDFSITYDRRAIKSITYTTYFYGNQALSRLENMSVINGKRLLVIYNSFSDCVIPFISLQIQNVDAINTGLFTGSVKTFMKIFKPDAVIVEYHSSVPGTSANTIGGSYDFR